jgi:soluble lytic murein transglycosylase-like protein
MRRTIPLCLLAVVSALAQPAAAVGRQAAQAQVTQAQVTQAQVTQAQVTQAQVTQAQVTQAQVIQERAAIEVLIVQHAKTHGLPVELVRLVIRRESNFNPRAVYRGNFGLMQIRLGTARALGYRGDAEGLLDPATNMAYGVPYLAGAYRAAHGDEVRALVLYSRGYHDVH